jgi:ParB family chromosome partitioning protein
MSKKGLGTGLGALFGDAAIDTAANDFEYLPLQQIEPRQDQPRTDFDEEGINELADSISKYGIFNPIMVRSTENGYYEIVSGERRWRAARQAGLSQVPVRIVIADDKTAYIMAMIENLQRTDLDPIEEAFGYKNIMDEYDMTQDEVAQRVSKSRPAVANALRLLALPDELIKLVKNKELSVGSARALLALKNEERLREAAKVVVNGDMSVREVEALVRKMNKEKSSRSKQVSLEVDYLFEAQNRLTSAMGRRVTIKQGKGKGKIELEYYDQEDFDNLFDVLLTSALSEKRI